MFVLGGFPTYVEAVSVEGTLRQFVLPQEMLLPTRNSSFLIVLPDGTHMPGFNAFERGNGSALG